MDTLATVTKREDFVTTLGAIWTDETKDGFQLDDIGRLLERGAKAVVRQVVQILPGATGAEKAEWCRKVLTETLHNVTSALRQQFFGGLLTWAGYALEDVINRFGDGVIGWVVDNVLKQLIEWAYTDSVLEGALESAGFKAALGAI
jgi:hypothetical protein